jgi:hypothetical protein
LNLPPAKRLVAIKRLDTEFVRKLNHWAVLWPARPTSLDVIPTFIDVKRDPIVVQLKEWLRDTTADTPPPVYPAVGVVDDRPEEPVPPELRAMDPDVLKPLLDAGLKSFCDSVGKYYHSAVDSIMNEPLPSTVAPCSERLRQWKRLTASSTELSYKEMIECLGWHDIANDSGVVHSITKALLCKENVPVSSWSMKRGGINMWTHAVCLGAMHTASTYVARIRRGGVPTSMLKFVA